MADICFGIQLFIKRHQPELLRIFFLDDESAYGQQSLSLEVFCLNPGNICLVLLLENLFNHAFTYNLSVVVNQIDIGPLICLVFDREEEPVLVKLVAENCKSGTLINASHAAYTLVKINSWNRRCRRFCDCSVFAGKRTRVAGKTVKTVNLNESCLFHSLRSWKGWIFNYSYRVLL